MQQNTTPKDISSYLIFQDKNHSAQTFSEEEIVGIIQTEH